MIGNDVVDLKDDDSNPATQHPGFDARVFSESELERLNASPRRVELRWRLWAAKEAAYKAVSKVDPAIVFTPSRFRVELAPTGTSEGFATGTVSWGARRCRVTVLERDAAIHAVATLDAPDRSVASDRSARAEASQTKGSGGSLVPPTVLCGVSRIDSGGALRADPHAPSHVVRHFSRVRLAAELGVALDSLEIRTHGRIPQLWLAGARAEADLSLSHHGNVVAFACEIPRSLPTAAGKREEH
jgi:phosphopantetheinyl transferase (holo-ACP synthase)